MREPDQIRQERGSFPLLPVLLIEAGAYLLFRRAEALSFIWFAFGDAGGNLTAQYLITHSSRPAIDFGYHYGLLALLVGRAWFGLAGATPAAYVAANVVASLAMVMALARVARALALPAAGKLFIAASLGYALYFPYPNFAHMLEATLIAWGLAEQARGRRRNAFALAALATLAKPVMGFVYGGVLLALSAIESPALERPERREWLRMVATGAVVWTAVAAMLVLVFGADSFVHTTVPVVGARAYRTLHYGFFSHDTYAEYLPGSHPGRWLKTGAAYWLMAGLLVIAGGAFALRSIWQHSPRRSRAGELTATCAVMHAAFVLFFFAEAWSWVYYSYVLVIGCAAASQLGALARRATVVLCLFALAGYWFTVEWTLQDWRSYQRSAATAWLYAPPDVAAEWSQVEHLSRGYRTAIVAPVGAAALLFPGFEAPVSFALTPGMTEDPEIAAQVRVIGHSDRVILVRLLREEWKDELPPVTEIREALHEFRSIYDGRYFQVLERSGADTGQSSSG